jgi:UDP-N-acetylmuramate--alanine ligase
MCIDDPVVRSILPEITRPVVTYGFSGDADFRISDLEHKEGFSHFTVQDIEVGDEFDISLTMPGRHNALNATAAIVIAQNLGVSVSACQRALNQFSGIGRRFNILGDVTVGTAQVKMVDDSGHHPTELAATIEACRLSWPDKRLVVLFQPHRYSRTRDLFDDFAQVLSKVDALMMQEVYPAGETLIPGADSKSLCRAIRLRGKVEPLLIENKQALFDILPGLVNDDDVLLTMGAGDIGTTVQELFEKLGGQA